MSKALFSGLIAGSLAGAAAGMVLAPKPGPVLRRFVKQKGSKYAATVRDKVRGSE